MVNASHRGRSVKKSIRPPKRVPNNGIWTHALMAIGVGGFGLVCTFVLLWWQFITSANEDHKLTRAQTQHATFVNYFNSRIVDLKTQIGALASAPSTVEALLSYDRERIRSASRTLTTVTGYASRVDIIPKGAAEVDLNAEVPISFAALDAIKRAESQEFVGPEVSLNQRSLVYAAQPVTSDGVVVGVLFVALSREFFFEPLRTYGELLGQVRIEQVFEGSAPATVFEWGTGDSPNEVSVTKLTSPGWRLAFEPNKAEMADLSSLSQLLTPLAVALGMLIGGAGLAFSSLSRKLEADCNTLNDYATLLLRGRTAQLDRYRLPLFQQMAARMAHYGKAAPQSGRSKAKRVTSVDPVVDEVDDLLTDDAPEDDFLEVDVADDADENFGIEVSEDASPLEMGLELDADIFRAYDIRGVTTKNLGADVVYWIGRAYAAEASELNQTRIVVGRDGRHSSEELRDALVRGLTEGGVDVQDVGMVPTPLLYFATYALDTGSGIMITGSHNPPEYNGLKMVIAGETLAEERIQGLKQRLEENRLSIGEGSTDTMDLDDHYVDRVLESVAVAQPIKVVVDCGNGVAGKIAPRLIEELGCEVVPLYCDVDGDFPNHHPDPADPANLDDLITVVQAEDASLGLAFDGDGDRLGVVTGSGEIIWPDKLLMLFAQDIVGRNPGADIIYDVKCSRHLNSLIGELGGRPIMWKTGHSHIKAKLKETGALLAGEFSGHICFGERWYGFDDALYSAARLLEIIGSQDNSPAELFAQFPVTFATPELKIVTTEREKFVIMEKLASNADFGDGTLTTIDGLRVDYADGWGLIRPSNTSPVLSLRFEADDQSALDRIQDLFQEQLAAVDPALKFR